MKEHIQIVYFFAERIIYDPIKIADSFKNEFPILGEPIIMPINIHPTNDNNSLVAIFNQNEYLHITLTFSSFIVTIFKDYQFERDNIISKFFKVANKNSFNFSRFGYVNNWLLPETAVANFKNEKFQDQEIIEALEFDLAWFNVIKLDGLEVNYWQKYRTNKMLTNDLFVTYDVNTLVDDKLNINYDFTINFINTADKLLNLK